MPNTLDINPSGLDINITDKLFPTWPTIVATCLALLILLLVLTKLVYKPIKKLSLDRQKYIQNNIEESKKQLTNSYQIEKQAQLELAWARKQSHNLILEAKKSVNQIKHQEISNAKDEAHKLLKQAEQQIEERQLAFEKTSKQLIVNQAIEMAQVIIKQQINPKIQQQLIDNFIHSPTKNSKIKPKN